MIYRRESTDPEAMDRFTPADWQQMADEIVGVVNQAALQR
jgi:hypothetical protein